jgi:hypothetical protein
MGRPIWIPFLCAALAAPASAFAEGAREDDPRARVDIGFGPRQPRERPPVLPRREPSVPGSVYAGGATTGFAAGGLVGFMLSSAFIRCEQSAFIIFPSESCSPRVSQSLLIGLTSGVGGALIGMVTAGAMWRASQPSVRIAPAIGPGGAGVSLQGKF